MGIYGHLKLVWHVLDGLSLIFEAEQLYPGCIVNEPCRRAGLRRQTKSLHRINFFISKLPAAVSPFYLPGCYLLFKSCRPPFPNCKAAVGVVLLVNSACTI